MQHLLTFQVAVTIFFAFQRRRAISQTRGIHPMLFQCWSTVFDAGPTLKQHFVNALCLRDIYMYIDITTSTSSYPLERVILEHRTFICLETKTSGHTDRKVARLGRGNYLQIQYFNSAFVTRGCFTIKKSTLSWRHRSVKRPSRSLLFRDITGNNCVCICIHRKTCL